MLTHQPPFKYSAGYTAHRDAFNADLAKLQAEEAEHGDTVRRVAAIHPDDRTAADQKAIRDARPPLIKAIRAEMDLLHASEPAFVELEKAEQFRGIRDAEKAAQAVEADVLAKLVALGFPDIQDFDLAGYILPSRYVAMNSRVRAARAAYENARSYTGASHFSFRRRIDALNGELSTLTAR